MNLIDVTKQFGTPEACNDFLEQMRWPEGVECVNCGAVWTVEELVAAHANAHPQVAAAH